ncbi:MAG: hypothetical protein D6730_16180 [Bacteroidetes bacterium]|nr:MAG: hypothetical protein D6730_16180 [Bacteroidota bacterium]
MKPKRYPGSKPFTIAEKGLFFGREKDIEGLYNFICVEKLSVLYGKSGLGKTSLLNAGVIPMLQEKQPYLIISHRFGSYHEGIAHPMPLDNFAQQIKSDYPQSFLNEIQSENISLWQHLKNHELAHPDKNGVLIISDQFEELFTYPRGIEEFGEELARLLSGKMPADFRQALRDKMEAQPDWLTDEQWEFLKRPLRLKVLFSIRSDKMSLLNRLAPYVPHILRDCYELMPLTREQAESAIVKPATADGDFASSCFSYTRESLDKILDYLTQNGEKPVESFQLQILCQYVEENLVIQKQDTSISPEDLGDLESIYQNYYDHHISRLGSEEEQRAVRVFIEEGLIFEKEERRLSLYEGQIFSTYQLSEELLGRLVNTHLIRAIPDSTGGFSYEISHDTLVGPILRSKKRRKAAEEEAEALRKAEEDRLQRIQAQAKRRRRLIVVAASTAGIILVLVAALGWTLGLNRQLAEEREKAQKAARSGELIIKSMQMQDDATVALRLAQKAYELALGNPAILDIIGQYYAGNTFYKQAYLQRLGIGAVAFAPDNQYLLTGCDDHTARLWSLKGQEEQVFRGHKGPVKVVRFSPKGDLVLTASTDKTARLWRRSDGQLLQTFTGHTNTIYAIDFSRGGDTVLTAGRDGRAHLYKVAPEAGETPPFRVLEGHEDMILAASFSPDGNYVLTGSRDGNIKSWNLRNRRVRTFQTLDAAINCFAFSPNNRSILAGTDDNRIVEWDLSTGNITREYTPHDADVAFISFSPTGDTILSGSLDKNVLLWKISPAQDQKFRVLARLRGHTDFLRSGTFASNGQYILTASNDRSAKVWNLRHEEIGKLNLPAFRDSSLYLTPDEQYLLVGQASGRMLMLGMPRGDTLQLWDAHTQAVRAIAYSAASRGGQSAFLVTGGKDSTAILWQLRPRTSRKIATLLGHTGEITSVDTYFDEQSKQQLVLTGSADGTAILWDEQGRALRTFSGHNGPLTRVAFSPDGFRILTAGTDRSVKVWVWASGEMEHDFSGHAKSVLDACFSPGGRYILSGSADKTARLWDLQTGREEASFKEHQGAVNKVAFAPDGNSLLTAGTDRLVIQWTPGGRIMKKVKVHEGRIIFLGYSDDGGNILTAGSKGRVQISYTLLESLRKSDIDTLSTVQQLQFGILDESELEDYSQIPREDIRAYAYWYMQKTDQSPSSDRLVYLQKASELFRHVLARLASPTCQKQDRYEMGLVFVDMLETHLYLNDENLIAAITSTADSIQKYAPELQEQALPFVYAAYLLRDSTRADSLYDTFRQNAGELPRQVQQKVWLMGKLAQISDRFKTEFPGQSVAPLETAIESISQDLLPASLLATENRRTQKDMQEGEAPAGHEQWIQTADYFVALAQQTGKPELKELYLLNALKLYEQLPFESVSEKIFDVYKELGYLYVSASGLEEQLTRLLEQPEYSNYLRKKGIIGTHFSLFNAYLLTYQPEKALEFIRREYPPEFLAQLRPLLDAYLQYWRQRGANAEAHRGQTQKLNPTAAEEG